MLGIRALVLVTAMAVPALLHAQDVVPQDDGLSEIVVTAQKREQSLKDVPIAMSVVDAATIARTRSTDLRDLSRLVPNFSVQRAGSIDTVMIRGVGGGGRNIGFTTFADLSQKPEIVAQVAREIEQVNARLPGNAKVLRFANLPKPLDADEGELTRTRKLKREFIEERYQALIAGLYGDAEAVDVSIPVKYQDGRSGVLKATVNIGNASALETRA